MEDIEIDECVNCKNGEFVLGQLTHRSINSVFYTISPDPELNDYNIKLPEQQRKSIIIRFNQAITDINKHITVYGYSMHFEFNTSANLHVHGKLYIDETYFGYERNLVLMSKLFHKRFGRQFCKSTVSSKIEFIKDMDKINAYVNKSNVFEPLHKCLVQPTLQEFLTRDKAQTSCADPKQK